MDGIPVTSLIKRRTPSPEDDKVLSAIKKAQRRSPHSASRWTIGVRNEAHEIYRRCVVNGYDGMLSLVAAMEKLGFDDELLQGGKRREGYDAIFSK